jgi:hypothetical protein
MTEGSDLTGLKEFDEAAARVLASRDGYADPAGVAGIATLMVTLPRGLGGVQCRYVDGQDFTNLWYRFPWEGMPAGVCIQDIQDLLPTDQTNVSVSDIDVVLDRMAAEVNAAWPAIEERMHEVAPDPGSANPDDERITSEQGQWISEVPGGHEINRETHASFRDLVIARELSNLDVQYCLDNGECYSDTGDTYFKV